MARLPRRPRDLGFSMVEMAVVLVFMGVLMAGLASVFKATTATFYATGEKLSSMRRNRSSLDLLYDDLNSAGMYLTDLVNPPPFSATNPGFYILPNQPIANAAADGPQTADELYFYFDQPLNFQGTLMAPGANAPRSASQMVQLGIAPALSDETFQIQCSDPAYAAQVQVGQRIVFQDSFETPPTISSVQGIAGSTVTVVAAATPQQSLITGVGSTGSPEKTVHLSNAGVVFYLPAQMVKYSVQMLNLDPANPAVGIPCLVRDQGAYSPTGFVATAQQQIIAENVTVPNGTARANDGPFKVYLSANAGASWAGWDVTTAGTSGWGAWVGAPGNGTIQAELNTQVAAANRNGFTTTTGNLTWFRTIPALVRLDITTRTATKRTEFSSAPATAAYSTFTQSLVLVPRHFGLPQN